MTIELTMTDDEAIAVMAVLRDCAAERWEQSEPHRELCEQVQGRIRSQFLDRMLPPVSQPEPVSIEPIPPQIQSQVSAMMRDAGMIE